MNDVSIITSKLISRTKCIKLQLPLRNEVEFDTFFSPYNHAICIKRGLESARLSIYLKLIFILNFIGIEYRYKRDSIPFLNQYIRTGSLVFNNIAIKIKTID